MKIQSKNIKRPRLVEPFFNTELLPDNSYVTYINTTSQKNVTSDSHNIKKTLKSKKFSVALSHKYNQVKLYMNENRQILINRLDSFDFDEYLRGVRLKSIEKLSRVHLRGVSV